MLFPISELPIMGRGKGIKILNIPKARLVDRSEIMKVIKVISDKNTLVVYSGKRKLNLKFADLEHYRGERARRGLKLPRGFQKMDYVEVE